MKGRAPLRAAAARVGIALVPVLILCIPPVFRAVVNALGYTANWVSYEVGWDWHDISPFARPERKILLRPRPTTHWSVWLVLSIVSVHLIAMCLAPWLLRRGRPRVRESVRVLVGVNAAVLCFLLLALCLRIGMGHP